MIGAACYSASRQLARPCPKIRELDADRMYLALAAITSLTAKPWVRRVVRWELAGEQPQDLRLSWHVDEEARAALQEEIFGKHALIAGHDVWPVPEVVAGQGGSAHGE